MPKKKRCKRGHLRSKDNVYPDRSCKTCKKMRETRNVKPRTKARLAWNKKHPRKAKTAQQRATLKRGGWTIKRYKQALKKQKNCCALCGKKFTKGDKICADHKHTIPPTPRGLLHSNCNCALGLLCDSAYLCTLAAAYLEQWP